MNYIDLQCVITTNDDNFIIFLLNPPSRTSPVTYVLAEQSGEILGGSFYRPELLKVKKDLKKEEFHIDKIWEYKKEGRYQYALVSFKGYKGKEWVPVRDLVDV